MDGLTAEKTSGYTGFSLQTIYRTVIICAKEIKEYRATIMRYKKIILGVIISAFFLGLVTSCGSYSCDFNSGEEAQEYVLAKLEDKYDEEFTITDVKKYKEEKIGLNWIAVNIASKKNPSQTATVYARNPDISKMITIFIII